LVWLLRKCRKCAVYTLQTEECPSCGGDLRVPHPAKFSVEDKYGEYRRKLKRRADRSEAADDE